MGISKVAVLGGGQMGAGIAEAVASQEVDVVLIKATPGPADKAKAGIEKNLARLVDKGKIDDDAAGKVLSRITFSDDVAAGSDADLFIESIVEDIDVKKARFKEACSMVKPDCVLASNTSTLSITAMQDGLGCDDRFIGMHFFNPPTVMKLVEVVPTQSTDPSVTARAIAFVEDIGKTPVLVKDETGFIVNRLLTPYMVDAIRCLESGLADIGGIDTAMRLGANHPMGPLALADYIGLDIVCAMARNLFESFGQDYMAPSPLLEKLVAEGKLGRKTKLGFYDYSQRPPVPNGDLP